MSDEAVGPVGERSSAGVVTDPALDERIGRSYRVTTNGVSHEGVCIAVEHGRTMLNMRTGEERPGVRFRLKWKDPDGKRHMRWTPFYPVAKEQP